MKPIFIAASPNTQKDDVWLAFKQLFQPWNWYSKKPVQQFEKNIEEYMGVKHAIALDSARSAFYLTLKAMGISKGDEVLIPAFTCVVIINPVLWTGATPVYVDIDKETFNIDFADLEKKVTRNSKVLFIQHTFGVPVDMEKAQEFAKKYNLKIIEDAAHSIGGKFNDKILGTFGVASVLTFGIEKVISTVRGGMVVTNSDQLAKKIRSEVERLPVMGLYRTKVALLNLIMWTFVKPVYYLGIGKVTLGRFLIGLSRLINASGNMIEGSEYFGVKPKWLPAKMPGALAKLGINQLKKIDEYNIHRKKVEGMYRTALAGLDPGSPGSSPGLGLIDIAPEVSSETYMLRLPVLVKDQEMVHRKAKNSKIVLGNWYDKMFFIPEKYLDKIGYKKGTAPNAEWVSKRIVNLPMYWGVGEDEVRRIVNILG